MRTRFFTISSRSASLAPTPTSKICEVSLIAREAGVMSGNNRQCNVQ